MPELNMNGPGLPPPEGVIPNFDNPYNYQSLVLMTLVVCFTISTTFVALRMYIRVFLVKSLQWEDCKFSKVMLGIKEANMKMADTCGAAWVL